MMKTAILVDGGFYRKRARYLWGKKSPEERASELIKYCMSHLRHEQNVNPDRDLYRIFYYDCPPLGKTVYHPFLKRGVDFRHSETYSWTNDFFKELVKKRKLALRLGELSADFQISTNVLKDLCSGVKTIDDLQEDDFYINFKQKGVDIRIGVDITTLTCKKQIDQIILIAGDSDFVPAAKMARREGVDFILDPMWSDIKNSLFEHIDGLWSQREKKEEERYDA